MKTLTGVCTEKMPLCTDREATLQRMPRIATPSLEEILVDVSSCFWPRFWWVPILLAPVVQKVDSAIHWINHYPVDNAIGFRNTHPLDSDLSGG